jgi:radical SAM/Cys-rich protein
MSLVLHAADPAAIEQAAQRLAAGSLVGMPPETVYGLAADADNASAVHRIFEAKGRPSDHPLIVHLAPGDSAHGWRGGVDHYARELPDFALALMHAFWPGPLTLILPRRDGVAAVSAGGQDSVGLRCPSHPVAQALLTAARAQGVRVIDRCNLTILFEPGQGDLAEFLAAQQVEVVASMPCYSAANVDKQRGDGVFDKSIAALQQLNRLGYGQPGSDLTLNLVYNPQGAVLPPNQQQLQADYKRELLAHFGIVFNALFVLTNMPIQRFGSTLVSKGTFDTYMALLQHSFQAPNLDGVMCRTTVSVDWQGWLSDCDFNQQLGLPLGTSGVRRHLRDLLTITLQDQPIRVAGHCFGCTAGQGSSCGGAL